MNGERFLIWKLCTMRPTTDGAGTEPHFGVTAGVSALVTPIGRWLRRTKLDEVPQLRNVFAGEMSIVGPRPDVPDWIDLLNTHPTALTVRPGLTSLASLIYADEEFILGQEDDPVAAYATVVLPHKLVLNDLYANNVSFALDMAILGLSAASVLWPSGAKRGAHALCSRLEHRLPADSSA